MPTKIAPHSADEQTLRWIAMSLTPGFGPQAFRNWLSEHKDPPFMPEHLKPCVEQIFHDCAKHGIRIITWEHPEYPPLLRESRSAQPVLYLLGKWGTGRAIAMVGTRKASWNGTAVSRALVKALEGLNVSVVSGLAEGIDLACHRAALEFNLHTIAVLAQGLDQPLVGQRNLVAKQILENGGALISIFPPGTKAYKGNFLARNGIIAGICDATIVLECREQSGALNTAEHCIADSRKLLAVPGDILRGSAQGPNMLIESQEAIGIWLPVQLPILCQLEPNEHSKHPCVTSFSFADFQGECCTFEEICERTGKASANLLEALTLAEIDGSVRQLPDGRYSFS